jgi:AraC-like DNA-binding protein
MFDSYQHFLETPGYNKIIGDDYLIVEFKCPIKEEIFKAWSECHSIVYVLSGKKKWITPENEWMVKGGESIFVRKGAFMNQQYFEEGFCVLMFFMKDEFVKKCVKEDINNSAIAPQITDNPSFIYRINVTESLEYLYRSFFTYLKQEQKMPPKIIELKFREMLVNIVSDARNKEVNDALYSIAQNNEGAIQYVMEEQYIHNLKIEEFARLCGRSLSSFKREFKNTYSMTPGKWLTKKRLDLARNLLLKTNNTIQEICYDSGFESDSHFIRIFKNNFGFTPKQWRASKLKATD